MHDRHQAQGDEDERGGEAELGLDWGIQRFQRDAGEQQRERSANPGQKGALVGEAEARIGLFAQLEYPAWEP